MKNWICWFTHSWRDVGEFRQCLRCKHTQRRVWSVNAEGDYTSRGQDA